MSWGVSLTSIIRLGGILSRALGGILRSIFTNSSHSYNYVVITFSQCATLSLWTTCYLIQIRKFIEFRDFRPFQAFILKMKRLFVCFLNLHCGILVLLNVVFCGLSSLRTGLSFMQLSNKAKEAQRKGTKVCGVARVYANEQASLHQDPLSLNTEIVELKCIDFQVFQPLPNVLKWIFR